MFSFWIHETQKTKKKRGRGRERKVTEIRLKTLKKVCTKQKNEKREKKRNNKKS